MSDRQKDAAEMLARTELAINAAARVALHDPSDPVPAAWIELLNRIADEACKRAEREAQNKV